MHYAASPLQFCLPSIIAEGRFLIGCTSATFRKLRVAENIWRVARTLLKNEKLPKETLLEGCRIRNKENWSTVFHMKDRKKMLEQNALKECWILTEAEQLFCSSWFHMVRQGGLRFTGKNYFLGRQQKGLRTVALVDDLCYLPQRVYRCNSVSGKKSNNILIYVLF